MIKFLTSFTCRSLECRYYPHLLSSIVDDRRKSLQCHQHYFFTKLYFQCHGIRYWRSSTHIALLHAHHLCILCFLYQRLCVYCSICWTQACSHFQATVEERFKGFPKRQTQSDHVKVSWSAYTMVDYFVCLILCYCSGYHRKRWIWRTHLDFRHRRALWSPVCCTHGIYFCHLQLPGASWCFQWAFVWIHVAWSTPYRVTILPMFGSGNLVSCAIHPLGYEARPLYDDTSPCKQRFRMKNVKGFSIWQRLVPPPACFLLSGVWNFSGISCKLCSYKMGMARVYQDIPGQHQHMLTTLNLFPKMDLLGSCNQETLPWRHPYRSQWAIQRSGREILLCKSEFMTGFERCSV